MHESKPSRTAIWVALWRGVARFENPPIVNDAIADSLVPMPYRPILDVARALPRASGAVLGVVDRVTQGRSRHMALRTRAIDDAVEEAVRKGARQLVLLGAGLDARAWRMDSLAACDVFEVDHAQTQSYKRAHAAVLAPRARAVHFVAVDFERQDVGERLRESGYDPTVKAVFVWEGVTMYLSPAAIDSTLASVARVAAPGSTLAMTYHSGQHIAPLAVAVRVVREPFVSLFEQEEAKIRLLSHGFRVKSDESDPEWRARYLGIPTAFAVERLACATKEEPGISS